MDLPSKFNYDLDPASSAKSRKKRIASVSGAKRKRPTYSSLLQTQKDKNLAIASETATTGPKWFNMKAGTFSLACLRRGTLAHSNANAHAQSR